MSDEAFARRFYSDRAELKDGLGIPLESQRDEFTGEELYTLRSERYFLPPLDLDDDELAALQTCFYLLEGRFAYAEPLRLALQNLALGRSAGAARERADRDRGAGRGARPRLHARTPGPARQARGGDLEAAHGPLPLLVDRPRRRARADDRPLRAPARERHLVRDRPRPRRQDRQELPRLADPLRDPLRDPARARLPHPGELRHRAVPRPRRVAVRRDRRRGSDRGRRRHRLVGAARVRRCRATGSRRASSSPSTPRCRCSPAGSSARRGAPSRSSPRRCGGS